MPARITSRHHPNKGRHGITIARHKAKAETQADSWWMRPELLKDRQQWMATAYAKHPSVTKPIAFSIVLSPNGEIDA